MKITIKREQRRACPDLPNVSNLRDEGAKTKRMITNRGWRRYLAATPLRLLLLAALPALMLTACSTDDLAPTNTGGNTPDEEGKIVFDISFAPTDADGQQNLTDIAGAQTRVATGADFKSQWEEGDEIGVFAAIGESYQLPPDIQKSGNWLHNVKLTYKDGKWTGDAWWPIEADWGSFNYLAFAAYYPYDAAATDPTAIAFAVKTDQSDATDGCPNYNLSDLLTTGLAKLLSFKKGETVKLSFCHSLSLVQVNVPMGTLTGSGPNEELEVSLMARAKATVDMNNEGVSNYVNWVTLDATDNDPVSIRMQRVEDPTNTTSYTYRALVPAQEFVKGNRIFRLKYGQQLFIDASLTDKVTLTQGKAATFTRTMPAAALHTVAIPAGTFLMGSSNGSNIGDSDGSGLNTTTKEPNRSDDETQHRVTLTKGFYMSKYPVTVAQYAEFLNYIGIGKATDGNKASGTVDGVVRELFSVIADWTPKWNDGTNRWEASPNKGDLLMTYVTWYGAKAYADWIGGSLPTEAQWEYACRGGQTESLPFGVGDGKSLYADMANFNGSFPYELPGGYIDGYTGGAHPATYLQQTCAVGSYAPNGYGLYDMHGNVSEWCSDWYGDYGTSSVTDPAGPTSPDQGSRRVLRGGSWSDTADCCRSAYRRKDDPERAGSIIGFRVVFPDNK